MKPVLDAPTPIEAMPAHRPEAAWVRDLEVGDLVTLDGWFGVERIIGWPLSLTPINGVGILHFQTEFITPVSETPGTRFVVRGLHEPVTRWVPAE